MRCKVQSGLLHEICSAIFGSAMHAHATAKRAATAAAAAAAAAAAVLALTHGGVLGDGGGSFGRDGVGVGASAAETGEALGEREGRR